MDLSHLDHWHFECTEDVCDRLLGLVLEGKKKATSSSAEAYRNEGEPLPRPGDMSVITDWAGRPRCVIRTKDVILLPFRDMTFELAALEGEDDSLNSWRENHRTFFLKDGEESGYVFSEDMEVVFEIFEVVERLPFPPLRTETAGDGQ